jgi:hypothetical protein
LAWLLLVLPLLTVLLAMLLTLPLLAVLLVMFFFCRHNIFTFFLPLQLLYIT